MKDATNLKGFGLKWAGKLYGTNTGNIFVVFDRSEFGYTGILRFLDDRFGLVVYDVEAKYGDGNFSLPGLPKATPDGITSGKFTAKGTLDERGQIHGTWETELGTAGTLLLHPHDLNNPISSDFSKAPPQLFSLVPDPKLVE